MPDDDRGVLRLLIQILGQEEVPGDVHVVLVRKRDLPHGYAFAPVEIAGDGGDFLSQNRGGGHCADNGGGHTELFHCAHLVVSFEVCVSLIGLGIERNAAGLFQHPFFS